MLVTIAAVILAWRQYAIDWIRKRHELLHSVLAAPRTGSRSWGVACGLAYYDADSKRLPLSLRVWGETVSVRCLELHPDRVPMDQLYRIDKCKHFFPTLFPEAKLTRQ